MAGNVSNSDQPEATLYCLGQPSSHPVASGEIMCPACQALVKGARLGVYQVQRFLGEGRSSKTYLGWHVRHHQPVAIRLIPSYIATKQLWEEVWQELHEIRSFHHPSILPVWSCTYWEPRTGARMPSGAVPEPSGIRQVFYLLALRQFAPYSLAQYLAFLTQKFSPQQRQDGESVRGQRHVLVENIMRQLATALSAIHTRGLIHGALIPSNILLSQQGQLWITDLALARLRPPSSPFLAPELYIVAQASLQRGDTASYWHAKYPAADQYALASIVQYVARYLLPPQEVAWIEPVLQRALHSDPAKRFTTIDAFLHEFLLRFSQQASIVESQHKAHHPTLSPTQLPVPEKEQPAIMQAAELTAEEQMALLGGHYFSEGQYEAAIQIYQQALQISPTKAELWVALGDSFFALEHYSQALHAYEQAVRFNPTDATAWYNRGTALDALNRSQEASICYERASQLRAENEEGF